MSCANNASNMNQTNALPNHNYLFNTGKCCCIKEAIILYNFYSERLTEEKGREKILKKVY